MKTHQNVYIHLLEFKKKLEKYFPILQLIQRNRGKVVLPDYKCIFIHIPKTGGSSIDHVLNKLPKKDTIKLSIPLDMHPHVKALTVKCAIGNELWDEYFSFAFVRNPWDLMISCYNWWLQNAYIYRHFQHDIEKIEAMGSFDNFMHSEYGQEMINEIKGNMFDWLSDENGEIIVDYVGKFENIQEDWDKICKYIGIANQKLPHLNKTKRKSYQEYYSPGTKQIVYERFGKIIELYGYKF